MSQLLDGPDQGVASGIDQFFDANSSLDMMAAHVAALREKAAIIRDPAARGAGAWEALCDIQDLLAQYDRPVDSNAGYADAGLGTYARAQRLLTRHALHEAGSEWTRGLERQGIQADYDTIDLHAVNAFQNAFMWLRRSGLNLFADASYQTLGGSAATFFETLRQGHVDAARQKIRLSGRLIRTRQNDDLGFLLMTEVMQTHLPRLGVDGITPAVGMLIESSAEEVDTFYATFCQRRFRKLMAELDAPAQPDFTAPDGTVLLSVFRDASTARRDLEENRKFKPDSEAWHQRIIDCARILRLTDGIDTERETYQGLVFPDKASFDAAFTLAVESTVYEHMQRVHNPAADGATYDDAMRVLEDLRAMYGAVEAPEDTDPEYLLNDFWMAHVFEKFQLRSYTEAQQEMASNAALAVIRDTLEARDLAAPAVYEALADAYEELRQARFPVDDARAYAAVGIDYDSFMDAHIESAPYALNRTWAELLKARPDAEAKFDLLERMQPARDLIDGTLKTLNTLDYTETRLQDRAHAILMRSVAEHLAESLVCLPGAPGAYTPLDIGFSRLDAAQIDVLASATSEALGLTPEQARAFERQYHVLDLADDWKIAIDADGAPERRFEASTKLIDRAADLDVPTRELFLYYTGTPEALEQLPDLHKDIAAAVYNEATDELEVDQDDPWRSLAALEKAKKALLCIDEKALLSDVVFYRITGSDRLKFLADVETYKQRTVALLTAPARPLEADITLGDIVAMAQRQSGADTFRLVVTLARRLQDHGATISAPASLQTAGMTESALKDFVTAQALRAARDSADLARAASDIPANMDDLTVHAYAHYSNTLDWVIRSGFCAMSDAPWRMLGFAGRGDFTRRARASLVSLNRQLEDSVLTGAMPRGPYAYLMALRNVANTHDKLETKAPRLSEATLRKAIAAMGYAACMQVIREGHPPSRTYKNLRDILTFATAADALVWSQPGHAAHAHRQFLDLIEARVTHALDRHLEQPRQPGRAVTLALAISGITATLPEDTKVRIDDLFLTRGYAGINGFGFHAASLRVQQIVARLRDRYSTGMAALRDLERIDTMRDSRLIAAGDVFTILESMGLDDRWLRTQRRTVAQAVLPQLMQMAQDPALDLKSRWDQLELCRNQMRFVGELALEQMKLDWDLFDRTRIDTARQLAAARLIHDSMRAHNFSVSPEIIDAGAMIRMAAGEDPTAKDWRAIGLSRGETANIKVLLHYTDAYTCMNMLRDIAATKTMPNLNPLRDALLDYYEALRQACLDPAQNAVARRLGFDDAAGHAAEFDPHIRRVLTGMHNGANVALEARRLREVESYMRGMLQLMDVTGIEKRMTVADMKDAHMMTRQEINASLPKIAKPPVPAI